MNSSIFARLSSAVKADIRTRVPALIVDAKDVLRDEEGVTAIEYALIASLIALAIIGAVTSLGTTIGSVFSDITTSV